MLVNFTSSTDHRLLITTQTIYDTHSVTASLVTQTPLALGPVPA